MNIIHVCDTATVRVFKEVYELQKRHDVTLMYRNCQHRDLLALIRKTSLWTDEKLLEIKLLHEPESILHIHSSINSAGLIAIAQLAKKSVWDIHDLIPDNFAHMSEVNAVVIPSQGYANQINHHNKLVIYSKVPRDFVTIKKQDKIDAICLVSEVAEAPIYRNYHEIITLIPKPFFIFPANATGWERYSNVMQRLPYLKLLDAIQAFKYGYAGSPNSACNFNDIVTNKFWEYRACGIELYFTAINESHEMFELFKNTKNESEIYMDDEIKKLEDLYASL